MKTYTVRGGLAGKMLRVDLNNTKLWEEETQQYATRFLGGRAMASDILLHEMAPETKWSDPENMVIFTPGLLVGTLAPGAARTSVDTKSAFNNGKGSANFGGHFGGELKFAGFDSVIITGKSEKPVYLWIHDGSAELRDAASLWGQSTYETERILQAELQDKRVKVVTIGPAGENLVRGSAVIADSGKAGGGSGVGCILGDKKLKAIAVSGRGSIRVANPDEFMRVVDAQRKQYEESVEHKLRREKTLLGSDFAEDMEGPWNLMITDKHGQDSYWPVEKRRRILRAQEYRKKIWSCFTCPMGGLAFSRIDKGKYAGTISNAFWINHIWWLAWLGIDDPEAAMKYSSLATELGLDGDFASVVLGWAFECYEKGLLTKEDTDGLALNWGDGDTAIEMLKKLAYRDGFGDFLANGATEASAKLGKGSEKFVITMKGQDSVDPYRVGKGWALGVATSPVAGRHLRGAVGAAQRFGPYRFTGEKVAVDPTGYERQPEMVFWQSRMKEIEDMLGICTQVGSWGGGLLGPSGELALLNAATGADLTEEEMMLLGQRSYALEKAFNTIHVGFTRVDDLPPLRYIEEPIKTGPLKGEKIDRAKFDQMLDKFYELQGWDVKTGLQTHQGLVALDLEDVADKIREAGRLIE